MCSYEFKLVIAAIGVSMIIFLVIYLVIEFYNGRNKCPQCGSHNLNVLNVKGNRITRKCNKCGHEFHDYESLY